MKLRVFAIVIAALAAGPEPVLLAQDKPNVRVLPLDLTMEGAV